MNIDEINLNDVISFETALGERYVDYRYQGSVPWDIASKLGLDVEAKHRQYSLSMPPGSPKDFKAYSYLVLKSPTNVTAYIGTPWVKENSIELKTTTSRQMIIPRASEAQVAALRSFATSIGLIGFEISDL